MLELLRSLEWQAGYNGHVCPSCRACEVDGHAPGCRLDRAIRDLASSAIEEVPVDEPIRVGSIVCPKPVPYKGTVWRVDRIERGRAYMTRVDQPAADYRVEAVFPVEDVVAAEPTVDEMAREMGLDRDHGGFYGRMVNGEVVEAYAPKDIPPLYREHKARQLDATLAGKRVGPWLTPPAPKVYEASGPPTDPSALAAWLYARVVPGRTVVERGGEYKAVVRSVARGRRCIILTGPDGEQVTAPGTLNLHLLNPDGSVLWEAK